MRQCLSVVFITLPKIRWFHLPPCTRYSTQNLDLVINVLSKCIWRYKFKKMELEISVFMLAILKSYNYEIICIVNSKIFRWFRFTWRLGCVEDNVPLDSWWALMNPDSMANRLYKSAHFPLVFPLEKDKTQARARSCAHTHQVSPWNL